MRPLLFALLLPAAAQAAEAWVQLGALQSSFDTTGQISSRGAGIEGSSLRLEDDLALPERRSTVALQFGVKLGPRWRAEGEAFKHKRTGRSRPLDTTVTVDDTTYAVAAEIDTRFESQLLRLGLGYAFMANDTAELGVALGVHATRFRVAFAGTVSSGSASASGVEDESVTAPLPTLGFFGQWSATPEWRLAARADYFKLTRGSDRGRLTSAQLSALYRMSPSYGLGLGWRVDDYVISSDTEARTARVEYRLAGPQLFFEARF